MATKLAMVVAISIIDVLENSLGEVTPGRLAKLTQEELADLAEAVNAFYDAWEQPAPTADESRLYSGGWIASNLAGPEARQYLYTTLLYAPVVVIHDPVAQWFDPRLAGLRSPPPIRGLRGVEFQGAEPQLLRDDGYHVFRDEPERSRQWLANAARMLMELRPLIQSGVVIPVPQWRIVRAHQQAILTAVRNDVKDPELARLITKHGDHPPPRSDYIRGMEVGAGQTMPQDVQRAAIQNPSYFLNKTLAIASASHSRYMPPAQSDADLLTYRLQRLGDELQRKDIDLRVIAAVASADLPFFADLDAETMLAMRRNESAFADWRAVLRSVTRTIESLPDDDSFATQAREALADSLLPRAKQVEATIAKSSIMRSAAKDQLVNLGLGAASAIGAATTLGAPVAPAALVGLGISAVARWTYTSVFGGKEIGANAVLAKLVKKR